MYLVSLLKVTHRRALVLEVIVMVRVIHTHTQTMMGMDNLAAHRQTRMVASTISRVLIQVRVTLAPAPATQTTISTETASQIISTRQISTMATTAPQVFSQHLFQTPLINHSHSHHSYNRCKRKIDSTITCNHCMNYSKRKYHFQKVPFIFPFDISKWFRFYFPSDMNLNKSKYIYKKNDLLRGGSFAQSTPGATAFASSYHGPTKYTQILLSEFECCYIVIVVLHQSFLFLLVSALLRTQNIPNRLFQA